MIELREGRLHFPEENDRNSVTVMEFFEPRLVRRCWVALRGYDVRFRDREEHEIAVAQVSLECELA